MKNMQIAGTGNSRFMKSAISETASWEEFREMLRAGTFAFDFNGLNEEGITEKGTPYDVDNVLKDVTAILLGGGPSMVPDEAFYRLKTLHDTLADDVSARPKRIAVGSYTGTGAYGSSNPNVLTLGFYPKLVAIAVKSADSAYGGWALLIRGSNTDAPNESLVVSWGDTSVSWYSTESAASQLNWGGGIIPGQGTVEASEYVYAAFG